MAGVYVHVPFCHSKCFYCDFYSMPCRDKDAVNLFVESIIKEYSLRKEEITEEISTIYLGGGTPSILPAESIAEIIQNIHRGPLAECTIEANPEDIDLDKTSAWLQTGINRVSMGVQSFNDRELAAVGRRHNASDAVKAYNVLRESCFNNISLDLIFGLPHQTIETFTSSLRQLLELKPEHFSAYMLSYEHGTRLSAMLSNGKIMETDEDVLVKMYDILCREASNAGYIHYEISNFCLPGKKALHNSNYWNGTQYLGLGPSAHSFDGSTRRYNPLSLKEYTDKIKSNTLACVIDEEDDCNRFNDSLMTALRTAEGIDLKYVDSTRLELLMHDAAPFLAAGSLVLKNNRLSIPEKAWLVSDDTISSLMQTE